MAQLVIVSNRVAVPDDNANDRAGGLEVAVNAALKRTSGTWFGWSGKVTGRTKITTQEVVKDDVTYITLDLAKEDFQEYYNGFANRVLWPILHYRVDLAEFSRRDLTGYLRVNDHFARELHKVLGPDDLVWVHDYHLMPLGKALRDLGHKNRIGFFLHIPCPPPEMLTALPHHERLIPALCDYDLVGFQTGDDAFNFSRYLTRECGWHSHDFNFTVGYADDARRCLSGRHRDRGVCPHRAARRTGAVRAAGARQSWPAARSSSASIGSITPRASATGWRRSSASCRRSRTGSARSPICRSRPRAAVKFRNMPRWREGIGAAAGRINGAYGEADWTPIRYVNRAYSRATLAGLYRAARAGLVTPLRDGMNLVAKEYVASQNPHDPGVLILSRFAGAARECEAALLVNPYDPDSVAAAIGQALAMPLQERRDRHDALFKVLSRNDIQFWADRFLKALERPPTPVGRFEEMTTVGRTQ